MQNLVRAQNDPQRLEPVLSLKKYYFQIIFLIFLAVVCINTLNHEMWEDEWQAWLLAKHSSSLSNLFYNIRYEGHPALWYLCLYVLNIFTDQPVAMQIFHLALCAAAMYIFVRYSPFTKLQKTLFLFGYFPLYEYSAIARNYGIGMMFLFAFCASFRNRKKNYLIPLAFLALLTQSNAYGLVIAAVCGALIIYEALTDVGGHRATKKGRAGMFAAIALFVLAVFISAYQILPPLESWSWRRNPIYRITPASASGPVVPGEVAKNPALGKVLDRTVRSISTLWTGYVPIPELTYNFWDTNIVTTSGVKPVLAVILFFLSFLLLCKKPRALFLYSFGTLLLIMVTYKNPLMGRSKYNGFLFMLLIAALWISHYYRDQEFRFTKRIRSDLLSRYKNSFIIILLICQVIAGVYASAMDWKYPFSESKETANFIRDKGMDHMVILGHPDFTVSPVSGYLNREFYYPSHDSFGSFFLHNASQGKKEVNNEDILNRAENLASEKKSDLLLIIDSDHKLNDPNNRVMVIREFDKSMREGENYVLYLMRYPGH